MNNNTDDISLIRKYHNGELDNKAMHQLERRAQDDPFLSDALGGYGKANGDQQKHIDELHHRIQRRTGQGQNKIVVFWVVAIAASVIAVLAIGGLWLNNHSSKQMYSRVEKGKPLTKPIDTPALTTSVPRKANIFTTPKAASGYLAMRTRNRPEKKEVLPAYIASNDVKPARNLKSDSDAVPLNEVVVTGYATQRKKDITASVATITPDNKDENDPSMLEGQSTGLDRKPEAKRVMGGRFLAERQVKGVIRGKDDGQPIAGATVKVDGRNFGTVTDANGHFALADVKANAMLYVTYIGYQQKKVRVNLADSLNISLDPNSSSLSEVVVTGYGSSDKNSSAVVAAQPVNGWKVLKNYLKEKAITPNGMHGVVKLSFTVNADGSLDSFKIIRSFNEEADQKAIRLLKAGPAWKGRTDGSPETIKLRIKFN